MWGNRMADHKPLLRKLVALKRQKAEQSFQSLQQDRNLIETTLRNLSDSLQAMNTQDLPFDTRKLAHQQGRVEKLIADIDAQRVLLAKTQSQLALARDALKRALHSEDRLQRMAASG